MKSLYEHLNHRLDQIVSSSQLSEQYQNSFLQSASDESIDELIVLARRIREAEAVQASSDFAQMLERRVLRHYAEVKIQQRDKKPSFFSLFRTRFTFSTVMTFCFLFILASTSTLVMAARVTNPNNPFYVIKNWEQNVQLSLTGDAESQVTLNLQFAHERLNTLPSLTSANQASAYRHILTDLDQNIRIATSIVHSLPAGTQHDHLSGELTSFKGNAIHILRSLLSKLAVPERLATTDELANLGDKVPHIDGAILQLPAHPDDEAIIRVTGNNIDPQAHLLIDGQLVDINGYLHHSNITFAIGWYGHSYPHSLGIINPDDTTAQTVVISIQNSGSKSNQSGNNSHQSGNKPPETPSTNDNKPSETPSANGNKPSETPSTNGNKPSETPSANGNKPSETPSANGNKPTATPPARH